MKKIKVKIVDYSVTDPFSYGYFILSTLKKYYDVELSENPDYIFFNESFHEQYKYDCIKISFTGENISPNFNICDYAISYDYISFEDRHFRLPVYHIVVFYNPDELAIAGKNYLYETKPFTREDFLKKTDFCSFVYSNYRADIERKSMFETLSSYKKVNAAGSYLNNNGGERIKNKLAYEMRHKFVIAFENSSRSGYTTEKLVSALVAQSIPIYWGNPNIGKEFNTKRFINCHDYESFDDVLKRVQEIDQDDELYMSIVNEPIMSESTDFAEVVKQFELFMQAIFDQPLEKAKRRTINPVRALAIKEEEKVIARYVRTKSKIIKHIANLYKPFKKSKTLESIKHAYFSRKK